MAATAAMAFAHNPGYLETLEAQQEKLDEHPQLRKSCDYCVRMKRGCSGGSPCELCRRRKKECIRSVKKRSGPAKGTKYCKRKPRKNPKTSHSASSSSAAYLSSSSAPAAAARGGGASAAPTASKPSGGPSNGPAGGGRGGSGGDKKTAAKARLSVSSLSRKFKREASDEKRKGAKKGTAAKVAADQKPSLVSATPTATAVGAAGAAPEASRWSGGGRVKPELVSGTVDAGRRGSYFSTAASDGYGSRRSSSSLAAFGMVDPAGDQRHVIEAGDSCSGSLMPFYFGGSDSGADGRDAGESWDGGGGGRAAEYGYGGGGNAEAEHQAAARMMSAGPASLEEALYGPCHKRASFHAWGPTSSFDTSQHPHNHSHRPSPSAEGSAWNQLSQHADASGTVQGGHNGSIERCDDPAGGVRLSPALSSSSAFRHTPDFGSVRGSGGGNGVEGEMETKISPGSVAQQQQQSSAVMPPPRSSMSMSMSMSMLSTFGSHHHLHNQHAALAAATHTGGGGAEVGIGGGGGGGGSNMPSLRDLLLDKPAQAQGGPTDGDLSMVV